MANATKSGGQHKSFVAAFLTGTWCVAVSMGVIALPAISQQRGSSTQQAPRTAPPPSSIPPPVFGGAAGPSDPAMRQLERRQAVIRNADRQKQLVEDTNRLLQLAMELKTAVDKSNKDTLSIDVIKKADEIQKLAKSVRDKMREE